MVAVGDVPAVAVGHPVVIAKAVSIDDTSARATTMDVMGISEPTAGTMFVDDIGCGLVYR